MKLNFKYIVAACALACLSSCDNKFETFEVIDTAAPADFDVSTVRSEALPGQIQLTWDAPEGDFAYMQIRYYDPLQKKDMYKLVSKGTTEMLIENTRARFGAYTFYMQTFNAAHQGGQVKEVNATSCPAEMTYTEKGRTKVNLVASQLQDKLKTLTVDHGKEFANYQTIEQLTGTQVYFAHAYSPHERGSNENRNRVLRRFIPKGQAIEGLSDYQLVQINWYLNSRPLKCLNWHTPIEIFLLNLRH